MWTVDLLRRLQLSNIQDLIFKGRLSDKRYPYIEDYTSVWIVTQVHNCEVRKDSDQSNHTIP